jgi:hypothetical protein
VLKTICYLLFSVLLVGSFVSCKKNNLLSKKNLEFSLDTLVFDTVFTTIGSTTKQFKIYNNEKKTVQIDQIELMGGENSPFRMNVDGNIGTTLSNIRIEGKDSLFVFVEVTLDINSQSLPMIVEDSIRFRTNGKDQYVKLAVWGQDMYFHYSNFQQEIYDFNEGIWPNDKPHVIYGAAIVDSAKTLTIQAGTQVHLHKNSVFYVYKSTLNIIGIPGNEVVFQGDRLEQDYQDVAGQYYGIYFQEARPSTIDYAILKNGTSGVHLFSDDPSNPGYTLIMTNTIIQNQARYGVFIYSGAKVKAENCIISKNGTHALLVLEGGDFNFNHCDLLGYGSSQNPAVGISNYFTNYQTATTNVGSINEGILYNCVLSGNLTTELAIDTIQLSGVNLNFDFKNCLIKSEIEQTDAFYQSIYWNNDPMFTDPATYDFSFLPSSTLNGNGFATSVVTDIFGNLRNNPPDIGAIELN